MHINWTVLFVVLCHVGVQGFGVPYLSEEEIDNISDSSSDFIVPSSNGTSASSEEEREDENKLHTAPLLFQDPKVYGMNIGLHFILEDINRRLATGNRVHLESLIKVLVLTHKLEKVGGTVNESNKMALKNAARLYPLTLKEAMHL